jgi:HAD superfamily hydrolase (TIGR01509 family)
MSVGKSAVIFDLDGTLTRPQLDFDAIRKEIGLPAGPILESIAELDAAGAQRAMGILERHEWHAAENAVLHDGAVEVVSACHGQGHGVGLLTRNSRLVVDHFIEVHGFAFDAIRTRDDGAIKPSPAPVLSICSELGAEPRRSFMVGDFLFDILSGSAAGAKTILMVGDDPEPEFAGRADYVIQRLEELLAIVRIG